MKKSDVVVENFAPGTMGDLRLDYPVLREINARIIYASISGYGATKGPYSNWRANNATIEAMSGVMDRGPAFPGVVPSGLSAGDTVTAVWAAYGITLALLHRNLTGMGQFIDVAMYDCLIHHNIRRLTHLLAGQADSETPQAKGIPVPVASFSFRARVGFVSVSLRGGRAKWNRLWKDLGRQDLVDHPDFDPALPGQPAMVEGIVKPSLEGWSATRSAKETVDFLQERDWSAAPLQMLEDVIHCPHLALRKYFAELDLPAGGTMRIPGNPLRLSAVPKWPTRQGPAEVGEHTAEVLGGLLGLSDGDIRELKSEKVI